MHGYYIAIDMLTNHLGLSVDEAIESINLPTDMMAQLKKSYLQHKTESDEQRD